MNAELHELYSLTSIVKFLLILVMTSYMENFKGFRKGYKITFTIFQNTAHFYSLLWVMCQKIVTEFELRFSKVGQKIVFLYIFCCTSKLYENNGDEANQKLKTK